MSAEALAVVWKVQDGFLEAALQAMDDDHGGVERHLELNLGLNATARDTLTARYLQSD